MVKLIIYMILLIDLCFFYLIPRPGIIGSIINNYQKIGLSIFIIITSLIISKKIFKDKKYLFLSNIVTFIILVILEVFLSYMRYGQNGKSLLATSNHYIVIIAYFIIYLYESKKENKKEALKDILIKFITIISLIILAQFIIYNISGILFLNIDKQRAISSMRYGTIRIYESSYLPVVGIVLSFGTLLKNNNSLDVKRRSIICLVASFFNLLFVSKGRMALMMAILSCIYMTLKLYSNNKIKKYLFIIILIISTLIFIKIPFINEIITSLNMKDYSLITRVEALEYYMQQLKENLFLGIGFIEAIEGDYSFYFVKGPYGMFYKDDMGIFGMLHTFGFVGIIWYIMLVMKIFKILSIISKNSMKSEYIELYGMVFLVFVGAFVMNPFDPQRIIVFPFLLALIDSAYREVSYKKLKENINI